MEGEGTESVLQAQHGLYHHIFNYIDSLALKCAVELGIPDAIHRHGRPISLSELLVSLGLPPVRASHLGRLMRLLVHSGVFTAHSDSDGDSDEMYLLTPISRLLVTGGGCQSPLLLNMLDPVFLNAFQFMGAWFRGDSPTPFEVGNGCGFWDFTNQNLGFNEAFNAAMASDSLLLDVLLKKHGDIFRGITSLLDVGGGTGSAARAIVEAFPEVKCTVLDLTQVVDSAPQDGKVDFITGDMFECIPPADAILLKVCESGSIYLFVRPLVLNYKYILHDWGDEDCVKIVKRCKEAIPNKERGGKVIIIDILVEPIDSHHKLRETQLYFDILMMGCLGGAERSEGEWKKIFDDAGFTDYKITTSLGLRSVIELYP